MKKFLAVMLVVVMLVPAFAACGSTKAIPNFDVPEGGYDGSAVTITFYHTMGESLRTVLDKYIAEFNKLYPKITVEHRQVGGYDDVRSTISTEITAGNQPNIAYCYPDHVALYNTAGAVATLDNLIDSTIVTTRADGTTETLGLTAEQQADFITGYYEEGRAFGDGLMYTLPFSKSTEVLYYNKTFFDEHNLTVPTTWDEMEQVCAQIKAIDPTCIPLGYDSESNWFITMCEQLGSDYTSATGDKYLFNNKTNRDFVNRFREWYQKNYVTTQNLYGAYTSGIFVNTDSTKTRSYMSIGSSAGAIHQRPDTDEEGNYPFEVGITSIPQVDASNPKVISQGPSVCIFKKENPQEVVASWLFVKYLTTSAEFQADFSIASGYVPVLKSVQETEKYKTHISKVDAANRDEGEHINDFIAALSTKVCLEQADAYYVSPAFNGSSTARDQVGSLMTACFILEGDDCSKEIEKLFKEAIEACKYMG